MGMHQVNLRDWPIAGAMIAVSIAGSLAWVLWWQASPAATPPLPPPAAAELGFDRDRAFAEFRARSLGLPAVWTFTTPTPQPQKGR